MKKLLSLLGAVLIAYGAFSQVEPLPKPRFVDKDYRREYREAIRYYDDVIDHNRSLPGDIIQLPKEEMIPVDKLTPDEYAVSGIGWHEAVISPNDTQDRLLAAWKYKVVLEWYDTGIDEDHVDLQVGKLPSIDGIGEPGGDLNGHGTHTAGSVVGARGLLGDIVAAGWIEWRAVKVLNRNGFGNFSTYASQQGAGFLRYEKTRSAGGFAATNSSLGANIEDPLAYVDNELRKGWEYEDGGIFHIAAAGNSNSSVDYPGSSAYTLSVGAVDRNLVRAYFSCYGPNLDFAMPGVGITATWNNGQYATLNGTSMSANFITGFVASALGVHGEKVADPERMIAYAAACSRDLGEAGKDNLYGYGLAMLDKILEIDPDDVTPPDEPEPPTPGPVTEWTVDFTMTPSTMRWSEDFGGEFNILRIPEHDYTCKTEAETFEAAFDQCSGQLEKLFTNRAIVGVNNYQLATYWSGRFVYIISRNEGFDIRPRFMLGVDEENRNVQISDFGIGEAASRATAPQLIEIDR